MVKSKRYKDAETGAYTDNISDRSDTDDDVDDKNVAVAPSRLSRSSRHGTRGARENKTPFRVQMWRYLLFAITCCLAVALCINLWASYGDFLEDSIWPPRVSSAGTACVDAEAEATSGTVRDAYQMSFDAFLVVNNETKAGWMRLNATKPPTSVLWAYDAGSADALEGEQEGEVADLPQNPHNPTFLDARWWGPEDQLYVWVPNKSRCATVIVFST